MYVNLLVTVVFHCFWYVVPEQLLVVQSRQYSSKSLFLFFVKPSFLVDEDHEGLDQ